MGRVFNQKVFKFSVFRTFDARESRAFKIAEMLELVRKYDYGKEKLIEMGYGDCLGEVSEYHETDSGWESRSYKNEFQPSWWWESGMKVGKNIPEDKEIKEALGEKDD